MWKSIPKEPYEGISLLEIRLKIEKGGPPTYYPLPCLPQDAPLELVERFLLHHCTLQNSMQETPERFFALGFRGFIMRAAAPQDSTCIYVWKPRSICGNTWIVTKDQDQEPGRFYDVRDEVLLQLLGLRKDNGSTAKDPIVNNVSGA